MIWAINAACPSRCVYCGIATQREKRELEAEEAVKLAREVVDAGFREVVFVGGEPLLYKHLPAVLDVLAGRVEVAVFSGGLPEDPRRWLDVLRRGATRLVLSIDAGDEDKNDLVRGRRGVSLEVWSLAEAVRRELPQLDVSVSSVITPQSAPLLAATWGRIRELRPTAWVAVLAGDNFDERPSSHFLDRNELERLYFVDAPALARRIAAEASGTDFMLFPVPLPLFGTPLSRWSEARDQPGLDTELLLYSRGDYNATFAERHGCPLVGMDISIGVDGEIYPCSQAPILKSEYALGSSRQSSLSSLLEPERLARFRDAVPHAPCRRCWAPSNLPRDVLARLLGARG